MRRLHHMEQAKQKKYWEGVATQEIFVQKVPKMTGKTLVTFNYFFPDKRRRDPDNYTGPAKYLLDGLVKAGVLPDDSFNFVELKIARKGIDRKKPRIEIVLEPLNEVGA